MPKRSFLFLQGVASPFFQRLALALVRNGHGVHRINFCGGDVHFWRGLPSSDFTAPVDELERFLAERLDRTGVSDLVLFGDRRPWHRRAIQAARSRGLRIWVFEEGYFRPHWITLERGGVNAASSLPRRAEEVRRRAALLPEPAPPRPVGPSMLSRALYDMRFHLASYLGRRRFPAHRTHRPVAPSLEYAGWIRRYSRRPYYDWVSRRRTEALLRSNTPFFLLPLQLNADAQILAHSPFAGIQEAVRHVVASFVDHAPADCRLVIKNHPLDTGLLDHPGFVHRLAVEFALGQRLLYLEGGELQPLLERCRGVVTVNSTVGLSALERNVPVVALGKTIYDMEGLTCQGGLDRFWSDPAAPDPVLFQDFRRVVLHHSQINGGFYSHRGIRMAVSGSVERLLAG